MTGKNPSKPPPTSLQLSASLPPPTLYLLMLKPKAAPTPLLPPP